MFVLLIKSFTGEFSSDRSRMRNPDGTWIKPPPDYDCIQTDGCQNNLDLFIQMTNSNDFHAGQVLSTREIFSRYTHIDIKTAGDT